MIANYRFVNMLNKTLVFVSLLIDILNNSIIITEWLLNRFINQTLNY